METYATAAAKGFLQLVSLYKTSDLFKDNFWFAGNAFHTCLDYMIYAKVNDANGKGVIGNDVNGNRVVQKALDIYNSLLPPPPAPPPGWWRDDYGWWGNAFVLAYNNRAPLGYGDSAYDALFNDI
jgi:hypothetical protein